MKTLYTFCLLLTSDFLLLAQAPQGIPYQAVARNASGQAIASTAVKVRFSIRDSIATGAIKYQETHNPTTSTLGLFSVNVGLGTIVSGTFSGINWGKNAKFLQVELDPAGGTAYTNLGTTQMMSVPYALHANAIKFITSFSGDTLYSGGGNFLIIPGISASNQQYELPVTDIDGNVYQTVRIGNQVWMKENLKVSKYKNGDNVPTGLSGGVWQSTTSGAFGVYNNYNGNNVTYGKLYNWYAVKDSRGLCPNGWHVPSKNEWIVLTSYLGGTSIAGGKMRLVSALWKSPNAGASNESGFSGLPGGYLNDVGAANLEGDYGYWWYFDNNAYYGYTSSFDSNFNHISGDNKQFGYSVRCLKD